MSQAGKQNGRVKHFLAGDEKDDTVDSSSNELKYDLDHEQHKWPPPLSPPVKYM
jgi:hypothetical protein